MPLSMTVNKTIKRGIQYNDTQHNAERCYAECHSCLVPFMMCVINKPFILDANMLNALMPSVVVP